MDEAFVALHRIIGGMSPAGAGFRDEELGVHSYIHRFEIDSPVELDVSVAADGSVQIGTTPPLYYVDTSLRPSYHQLRFVAELEEEEELDAG